MTQPAEWTAQQGVDTTRKVVAILRRQADLVLTQLDGLDDAAEQLTSLGQGAGTHAMNAVVRHGVDCVTKLEWAARALRMYRETLTS